MCQKKNKGSLGKAMEFAPFIGRRLAIGIYTLLPLPGNRIGSPQVIGDILEVAGCFNFIEELKGRCQLIGKSQ
jgi:hypothetical protein